MIRMNTDGATRAPTVLAQNNRAATTKKTVPATATCRVLLNAEMTNTTTAICGG